MAEKENHSLQATIDRFEGKFAVLHTEEKKEVLWPIKSLPDDVKEGSFVRLVVSTAKTEEEEREKIAKTLLNDILKGES